MTESAAPPSASAATPQPPLPVAFSAESASVPEAGLPSRAAPQGPVARATEWMRARRLIVAQRGCTADRARRQSVYWLAAAQVLLALFSLAPVLMTWSAEVPRPWAAWVWALASLQFIYAAWVCLTPDWSTTQVAMFSSGLLAASYSAATAVCWLTAARAGGWLQLGSLKVVYGNKPALWCAAVVLLASLVAYLCGHVSYRWRKVEAGG